MLYDMCMQVNVSEHNFLRQEEVYSPLEVTVETESGLLICRTYQMNNFSDCLPSPQYKQVRLVSRVHFVNVIPGDVYSRAGCDPGLIKVHFIYIVPKP